MARILIADDDAAFRESLAETLADLGHEAVEAGSGEEALQRLRGQRFDAVILDHRMPGMDGLQTLSAMRAEHVRLPPVVVLTAYASGGNTIEAMRQGAFDHLTKPVRRDDIVDVLARALRSETAAASESSGLEDGDELIGSSAAMREVHKRIGLAAGSSAPVLLTGETGTGKELVARALHRHSDRADRPFVAINCAAIPDDLLESELFGHVRGAFSGATADRPGCFRIADGGVLLLDEIGDMALDVQAKILRVLQQGEVTPLGSHRSVRVDVRLVAATHRDLAAEARQGRFREDLFYRLNVLPIHLPPLRERMADVVPLAEHFLRRAAGGEPSKALSAGAIQALLGSRWPGNVRELRNRMERCQALVRHRVLSAGDLELDASGPPADLPRQSGAHAVPDGEMPAAVERLERSMIERALQQAGGNRAEAARSLGIHRQLLYRKLDQYGIGRA